MRVAAAVRAGAARASERGAFASLDAFLSPLTPGVAAHLREVARRGPRRRDDVFAKVGASATVNRGFMRCLARDDTMKLGDYAALAGTVDFFRRGNAAGTDPYRRDSLAAKVGWSAYNVLRGRPSPLLREVHAISPRFALVMFGANDIENNKIRVYADTMLTVVDELTARGVIPILSNVAPRNDDPDADRLVSRYGRVVEAIARARRVPWIDLHGAFVRLPERGLMSDGVHPSAYVAGGELRTCDFEPEGLKSGQNVRNLLNLRMLDRLRRTVLDGQPAPDPAVTGLRGAGTTSDPVRIDRLPFAQVASTKGHTEARIARYPGCHASEDESGPERVYRLKLSKPARLRVQALYGHDVDVDVHLLGARASGDACIARADSNLVTDVPAGTYHIVVDTFVPPGGHAAPGQYVLMVERAPDQDPTSD